MLIQMTIKLSNAEACEIMKQHICTFVGPPAPGYHYFVEFQSWGDCKITTEKDEEPIPATPPVPTEI